jgi:predicted GTPase
VIRLFSDRAEALHFSFERYLQNRVRELVKLDGIPLKFEVRKSD